MRQKKNHHKMILCVLVLAMTNTHCNPTTLLNGNFHE